MREEQVLIGSIWRHFKGDKMKVLNLATHSETLETLVIYEHKKKIWARPITSWLSVENVEKREDNVTGQTYRFELERNEEND